MLSLRTPETNQSNNFNYLSEGLFLYWKSPRQNWDKIISESASKKYLIIPINWAIHFVNGKIHFGDGSDDLSLESLIRLGVDHGKKVVLSIAITPNPLVSNGGVPSQINGDSSFTDFDIPRFFCDGKGSFSRAKSFYSPEVFTEFSRFTKALGKFLSYIDLPYDVAATEYVFFSEDGICKSMIQDFGPAQRESLEKFKQHAGEGANPGFLETMILDLYEESVRESCSEDYVGRLKVSVLGTRPEDSINAVFGSKDSPSYNKSLINCFKNSVYPVSLSDIREDNELLSRQFNSLMNSSYLEDCLKTSSLTNDRPSLSMVSHLKFFHGRTLDQFEANKLISRTLKTIDKRLGFSSSSKLHELTKIEVDEGLDTELIFLIGKSFRSSEIGVIKKLFFSGKKIIFDTSSIDESFMAEFNIHFSSREIKKSKLTLETDLQIFEMGSSVMILLDSDELFSNSEELCEEFWSKVIYAAEIDFLKMSGADDVDYIWRKRPIKSNELNFEEIRRLNIYNPHNVERVITLEPSDRFFLLKKIDDHNATINRKTSRELVIDLAPKGSVGVEFGVVE